MHVKELHILAFHVALLNISKIVPVRVKICNKNELRIMQSPECKSRVILAFNTNEKHYHINNERAFQNVLTLVCLK